MLARALRCAALSGALSVLFALPAPARDTTVTIKDNYFTTPYILVTAGDEVTWVNSGSARHTVVAYDDAPRSFDSSPGTNDGNCAPLLGSADCMEPGAEFSQVLRKAGTYRYYCKVAGHADPSIQPDPEIRSGNEQPCGMCGIVVVTKKSSPPPLVRRTESPEPSNSPSASPSPSDTETSSPFPSESESPLAAGGPPVAASGPGLQLLIALLAIAALGGAGFLVYQRFLAPR